MSGPDCTYRGLAPAERLHSASAASTEDFMWRIWGRSQLWGHTGTMVYTLYTLCTSGTQCAMYCETKRVLVVIEWGYSCTYIILYYAQEVAGTPGDAWVSDGIPYPYHNVAELGSYWYHGRKRSGVLRSWKSKSGRGGRLGSASPRRGHYLVD
jgi:hypothetical protein